MRRFIIVQNAGGDTLCFCQHCNTPAYNMSVFVTNTFCATVRISRIVVKSYTVL